LTSSKCSRFSCHITLFFTYGVSLKTWAETGLLQREIRLYQELMRHNGVKVQFLTYGDTSDRQWETELGGIGLLPVYERLRKPESKILQLLQSILIPWVFRRELRKSDLFKTNQIWGGWVAVLAKWLYQKPLLARCGYEFYDFACKQGRSRAFRGVSYAISWLTYRSAQIIHVATEEDRKIVEQTFRVQRGLIEVRPNWMDTTQFSLRVENSGERILFVGRLNDQKNVSLLLQALEGTNIGLDFVGEGELHQEMETEAQERNVNVQFLGRLPNDQMPGIYQTHLLYVLCSRYEGNPKTLLEAMACGCAVIGTDVPGIREVICHEESGLLVEESVESLRSAIIKLQIDPDLSQRLGQRARKQIVEHNSLEAAVERELDVYRKLCLSTLTSCDETQ
jgi:glycosyltransferase involved in cell wall biosynthesis